MLPKIISGKKEYTERSCLPIGWLMTYYINIMKSFYQATDFSCMVWHHTRANALSVIIEFNCYHSTFHLLINLMKF